MTQDETVAQAAFTALTSLLSSSLASGVKPEGDDPAEAAWKITKQLSAGRIGHAQKQNRPESRPASRESFAADSGPHDKWTPRLSSEKAVTDAA